MMCNRCKYSLAILRYHIQLLEYPIPLLCTCTPQKEWYHGSTGVKTIKNNEKMLIKNQIFRQINWIFELFGFLEHFGFSVKLRFVWISNHCIRPQRRNGVKKGCYHMYIAGISECITFVTRV